MKSLASKLGSALGTAAQLGYAGLLAFSSSTSALTEVQSTSLKAPLQEMTEEVRELTKQIRLQNNFGYRTAMALAVGAGTALGASVVATLVLLFLRPILNAIGLGGILP